jgi:hypothetical protein
MQLINADDLKKRNAEYYKQNKEHAHNKFTAKVTCECGCQVSLGYLKRHTKTARHINNI